MRFDARSEDLLRMRRPLLPPSRLSNARLPHLGEVYQQAYERSLHDAVRFNLADDPSTVRVPPELDEFPVNEAWREGMSHGHRFGLLLRASIFEAIARHDNDQP
jgi:hypothetical protein